MENIGGREGGKICIIVPAFNERDNVAVLYEAVRDVLRGEDWNILFIDDGSGDGTAGRIEELARQDGRVGYLFFSRNFGHQSALKAGFDHAVGDCVISMDADMQHPPAELPRLLAKWREGYDAVLTLRREARVEGGLKRATSSLFYTVLSRLSPVPIPDGAADFRLLDRKLADICAGLKEDAFFWRGIVPWLGFSQCYIEYTPARRAHGKSKYTWRKMFRLALDGVTSFSIIPLRFAGVLGLCTIVGCLAHLICVLFTYFFGQTAWGWSSLMSCLLLLGGVQLLCLGVIGEYIGKIHIAAKARPCYLVRRRHLPGDGEKPDAAARPSGAGKGDAPCAG